MNIIDIIFIAILGISLISGMQKGFLASLLATFGFVGAWFIAGALCTTLSQQFMTSSFQNWLESTIPFGDFMNGLQEIASKPVSELLGSMNAICDTLAANGMPASVVGAVSANAAASG